MLVLSRKVFESIVINENIRITIVSLSGNRVRVGIEAPRNMNVARHELLGRGVNAEPDQRPIPLERAAREKSGKPSPGRSCRAPRGEGDLRLPRSPAAGPPGLSLRAPLRRAMRQSRRVNS
jgi:carbon storage regulator